MHIPSPNVVLKLGLAFAPGLLSGCGSSSTPEPQREAPVAPPTPVVKKIDESPPPEPPAPSDPSGIDLALSSLRSSFQELRESAPGTAQDLLHRAKDTGTAWGESAGDWSAKQFKEGVEVGREWGEAAIQWTQEQRAASAIITREWADLSEKWALEMAAKAQSATKDGIERVSAQGNDLAPRVKVAAEQSAEAIKATIIGGSAVLTKWGISVETQREMMRVGIDIVPVLGALKKYDDARERYKQGLDAADPAMQNEALALGLISFGELGFDIGLLGTADWGQGGFEIVHTLNISQKVGSATKLDIPALAPVAARLLEIEKIRSWTAYCLTVEAPNAVLQRIFPKISFENAAPEATSSDRGEGGG